MFTTSFLTLLLLQPTWVSHQAAESRDLQEKLQAKVENYRLTGDNFLLALTAVSAKFEIPMGIEWVKSPDTLKSINLIWQHATASEIIASLVKSQTGYSFEVKGGIVHIFPKGWLRDKHNFLNIRIREFEVENEYIAVASQLKLRPFVHNIVSPPQPRPPSSPGWGVAGSMAFGMGDWRVSFKLTNVTVRQILDKLSLAAGRKIWIVTYPEKATLTRGGFRRTASPYNGDPLPDEYQPLWELWPWGFEPRK